MLSNQEVSSSQKEYVAENGNDNFRKSVLITRKKLNVRAFIGVFIFGWLMVMNYDDLGKKGYGWAFLFLAASFSAIGIQFDSSAFIWATIIYLGAWIHTNLLLSILQKQTIESNYSSINETDKTNALYDFTMGIFITLFCICGMYAIYNEVIIKFIE
jgi:hypothetical protein